MFDQVTIGQVTIGKVPSWPSNNWTSGKTKFEEGIIEERIVVPDPKFQVRTNMAQIYKSKRGGDKILFQGFSYCRSSTNITSQNWRCDRKATKCRGSVTTAVDYRQHENLQVQERQGHNHPPDPAGEELKVEMDRMAHNAATVRANEPPRRVISDTVANLSQEAQVRAPKRKALTTRIQRKRLKYEVGGEAEPSDLGFQVPNRFRTVKENVDTTVRFLLHDDFDNLDDDEVNDEEVQTRIIVFATDTMLDLLRDATVWMLDGTFKVSPHLIFQLYTVHAAIHGTVFPCVYCLLPNKTQDSYSRVFQILKAARPGLNPSTAILDFEVAARNAMRAEFPAVEIQFCYFHLTQSVWRRIQQEGLREAYVTSEAHRTFLKSMCALAFLPPEQVEESFTELEEAVEEAGLDPNILPVLNYFEDTYVGRPRRRGRQTPVFPIEMWNVRARTDQGIPRTTNKIEGWHCALQTMVDNPHPSMWRFLSALQREQQLQHATYVSIHQGGQQAPPMKKKYEDVNQRLRRLIANYRSEEIGRMEFLRGVAYNIELQL